MAGQCVQQCVFPVQQQGALALALGADVLHQREQPVGRIGTGGSFARMGVGQGHAFHGDVHDRAEAVDGGERGGTVGCVVAQAHEQLVLEHARAAGDQVDRNADPGMHIADHPLRGHGTGDPVAISGRSCTSQRCMAGCRRCLTWSWTGSGVHARPSSTRKALCQHGWGIGGSGLEQRGGGRASLLQAVLPGFGQRLAGIVQLRCFHVDL